MKNVMVEKTTNGYRLVKSPELIARENSAQKSTNTNKEIYNLMLEIAEKLGV